MSDRAYGLVEELAQENADRQPVSTLQRYIEWAKSIVKDETGEDDSDE